MPTYLTVLAPHAPVPGTFSITTAWLVLFTCLLPVSGHLADRLGFYPVMLTGGRVLAPPPPPRFAPPSRPIFFLS
jgi:hypothetical protein